MSALTVVPGPDTNPSDLTLGTLSGPVMSTDGLTPFPCLNLASENAYLGTSLMIFGGIARGGSGTIASIEDISVSGLNDSRALKFVYQFFFGGNDELTLSFPTGTGPDTVTAPDWIVDGGGPDTWLPRRTTLASSETRSLTANWSALPLDESLNGSLDHLSDASPGGNAAIDTILAPSFAEWESQTGVSGPTGDPDFDKLDNLLEYALGGDPLSGALLLDGQHPLTLQIGISAGTATISFPVRNDAALRGLSYIVEWSSDLLGGSWTTTPPAGTTTSDVDRDPAVTGFQRRTIEWPATAGPQFARLRVELDEN